MTANRFKFRVWDKEDKYFLDRVLIDDNGSLIYHYRIPTFGMNSRNIKAGISYLDKEDYELMQSTGMVDKNGKEIFEGDIIESDFLGVGIIKYSENLKRFTVLNPNYANEEDYCGDMTWDDFIEEFDKNQYEVIGNIYENPELLEEFRRKLEEFIRKC